MQEQWTRWVPPGGICANGYITSLHDLSTALKIELVYDDLNEKMILHFNKVIAYSVIDEICTLPLQHDLRKQFGKHFYDEGAFFKVLYSTYIHQLLTESSKNIKNHPFEHFVIMDDDFRVDIIASSEPIVKLEKL